MLVYVLGNWGLAAVFGGPFFGEMAQERQRHSRMTADGDNGKSKTANDSNEALDYSLPGRRQGTTTAGGTKGKIKKVTLNLVQGLPYGLLSRHCSLTTNDQQKQKQQNNTKGRS